MRKSLEELKSLRQEIEQQNEEFIGFTNSINRVFLRAEFNKEGFLVYANDNFIETFEYNNYFELVHKHFTFFLSDSEKDMFDQLWDNILQEDKVFDSDMKFITSSGKEKWISSTIVPVRNAKQDVVKILFLGLDRTKEKQLVEEQISILRYADNLFVRLVLDLDGKIIDVNNNFLTITGLKEDEFKGKFLRNFMSIEDANEFSLVWRTIISGRAHITTHKFLTNYGSEVWFESYYFVYKEQEKIKYILLIGLDVTDKVKKEQALMELEEEIREKEKEIQMLNAKFEEEKQKLEDKYRKEFITRNLFVNAFEQMDHGVIAINETEHIVMFNSSAEKLWKIKKEVVLGKRLKALLPELPEPIGMDDVEYLLKYFNVSKPLLKTKRISYIIDKTGNRKNVSIYIVKATYEGRTLLVAFIKNMEFDE